MVAIKLRRNENSALAKIDSKSILGGLPARLIKLLRSHLYGENRLDFYEREGRND